MNATIRLSEARKGDVIALSEDEVVVIDGPAREVSPGVLHVPVVMLAPDEGDERLHEGDADDEVTRL